MTDYTPSEEEMVSAYTWAVDMDDADVRAVEARRAIARIKAEVWDERDNAKPQYLGPENGHYEDCLGYEDCYCATYPNPYREAQNG